MTLNIVVCKIACVHDLCAVGNFMYNVGLCRALQYGNIPTNNIENQPIQTSSLAYGMATCSQL